MRTTLERIKAEVETLHPGIVVVDSFRTVTRGGTDIVVTQLSQIIP